MSVSEGDKIEITEETTGPKQAALRISTAPEDMVLLHTYNQMMAERVIKFTADEWTEIAAKVGVPVQKVRSPEEALADQFLVDDGCVTEVDDAEYGKLRQVGRVYRLDFNSGSWGAPVALGQPVAGYIGDLLVDCELVEDGVAVEAEDLGDELLGLAVAVPEIHLRGDQGRGHVAAGGGGAGDVDHPFEHGCAQLRIGETFDAKEPITFPTGSAGFRRHQRRRSHHGSPPAAR